MKNYKKFTNFIPDSYINSINSKNSDGEIRMIKVLVILSLVALPLSLNIVIKNNRIKQKSKSVVEEKKEIDKSENLLKWVEIMNMDKLNFDIENEKGTVKVKDIKYVKKIEEVYNLKINSVKQEKNEYSIEVNIK